MIVGNAGPEERHECIRGFYWGLQASSRRLFPSCFLILFLVHTLLFGEEGCLGIEAQGQEGAVARDGIIHRGPKEVDSLT
jgi:hypothetical protein